MPGTAPRPLPVRSPIETRPGRRSSLHELVSLGGSVYQWVEELTGAVLDHGASGFTLFSADHGAPDLALLARWAQEIVPAVRDAIAK